MNVYSTATGGLVTALNFTDSTITSDYRSAASDGTNVWIDGSSTTGIRTNTITSPSPTTTNLLTTTSSNYRALNLTGGQLFLGENNKLDVVGPSITSPASTSTGQTLTPLTLSATNGTPSPFQFLFFSLGGTGSPDTLYIADDSSGASGIRKFSLVSGTWVENADIRASPATAVRGLTGIENSDGSVTLFATFPQTTASATNSSNIYTFTDTTGYNGTPTGTLTSLLSIPTATDAVDPTTVTGSFHGIALLPSGTTTVPEPASLGVLAIGAAALLTRRRK